MNWFAWVLVGIISLNALATVGMIDEPRQPISKVTAMFTVVVNALMVVGILKYFGCK